MKKHLLTMSALLPLTGVAAQFEKPVLLKAGDQAIKTESPGYAFPSLYDVNGDGKKDLLVGQFRDGKIMLYPGQGGGKFGKGDFLKAGGKVVEIPGVW